MKKFFILLLALHVFSGVSISRPNIITISAGSNIQTGNRLSLEWLHRIGKGIYAYSPVSYVNFQSQIIVPQNFQSNANFSMQSYETEGFRLTLDGDVLKRAHVFFPFNDKGTINYKFELVGNIIDRDSSSNNNNYSNGSSYDSDNSNDNDNFNY